MKQLAKLFLKYYLKLFTCIVLYIKKPTIIAVAGSTNKSFVCDEIKKHLTDLKISFRANPNSFNTEIGLPLAILSLESGYNEYKKWIPAILGAPKCIFNKNFPEYLVLELGVSEPGDMNYLLGIIKPDISVITDITQRNIDNFAGMDCLVEEYKILAQKTCKSGILILNNDNYRIASMSKYANSKIVSYSINNKADWKPKDIQQIQNGQNIEIVCDNLSNKYFIPRYGVHHIYAKLAGLIIKDYVSNNYKPKDD